MRREALKFGLFLGIGLSLFVLFLWKAGFSWATFWEVRDPVYLSLAFGLGMFYLYPLALRTSILLRSLGLHGKQRTLVRIEFINYFLQAVLPFRLNLPAKAWLLRERGIANFEKALSVTTFDYLLNIGTVMGIVFFGGAFVLPAFRWAGFVQILLILLSLLAAYFLLPRRVFKALEFSMESPSRFQRLWNRVIHLALELRSAWTHLATHRTTLWIIPLTAVLELIQLLANQALLLSAGVQLPWLSLLLALNASVFVGGVTPIPAGGLGVRDATMAFLLNRLGAPVEVSLYAVVMSRIMGLAPIVLGYLLSLRLGLRWLGARENPADPK